MQLLHTKTYFALSCVECKLLLNNIFINCHVEWKVQTWVFVYAFLSFGWGPYCMHASLCRMNNMAWTQSIIMYIYIHSVPQPLHLIDCTYTIICQWHTFMNLIGFFLSSHHLIKLEGKISEMDRPHINKISCHCSIHASHLTPTKIIS